MAVTNKLSSKSKERTSATKFFVKDDKTEKYVVQIKNITHYELALDHVGSGMTFWQMSRELEHSKLRIAMVKLTGVNGLRVRQFVLASFESNI